ncbi:hypothetical protein HUJ04_008611 [Dendroctonus ponderosae]|nr:hypothetical protein HUJ04_008611 [Dendroctonus ponderosae]
MARRPDPDKDLGGLIGGVPRSETNRLLARLRWPTMMVGHKREGTRSLLVQLSSGRPIRRNPCAILRCARQFFAPSPPDCAPDISVARQARPEAGCALFGVPAVPKRVPVRLCVL